MVHVVNYPQPIFIGRMEFKKELNISLSLSFMTTKRPMIRVWFDFVSILISLLKLFLSEFLLSYSLKKSLKIVGLHDL